MKELKFNISGMHCGSCEKIIQMELEDIEGVLESEISAQRSTGEIQAEDSVSPETIIAAISKAGYKAELNEG